MKSVAVFGGSGYTGQHVVRTALEAGFTVRALARDPDKLPEDVKDRITISQGDALNKSDVVKCITGVDAVVVALGTRNDLSPTTSLSKSMANIVSAMVECEVKPVSVCISAFLFFDLEKVPPRFLPLTEDHRRMSSVLRSSSLDWIAVYPPHIANIPGTNGTYTVSHEPEQSSAFRGRQVSVHDLAHFLVHSVFQPEHYHKICGIAT